MTEFSVDLIESVSEVAAEDFLQLAGPERYPFLRHAWLRALEETGCAQPDKGWVPRHVVIREQGRLVAFCPCYLKLHSFGEFVFDQGWAQAAELQLGIPYYPKLVVGIPFTPATGPRFLVDRSCDAEQQRELIQLIANVLVEMCEGMQLSSAHVLFLTEAEAQVLESVGFFCRLGVQYQFHNSALGSFDDFLAGFRSKRRAAIRRERRCVQDDGFCIEVRSGAALGEQDAALAYRLYLTTVDKYVWGRRYLNRAFFEQVVQTMPDALHLVLAKDPQGEVVAGAFNLLGEQALYGRYWGSFVETRFLHFEVCLYQGVQECIERGLERFEAGAGGEHKHGRGLSPTLTRSAHFVRDARLSQAARDFCEREAVAIAAELNQQDSE